MGMAMQLQSQEKPIGSDTYGQQRYYEGNYAATSNGAKQEWSGEHAMCSHKRHRYINSLRSKRYFQNLDCTMSAFTMEYKLSLFVFRNVLLRT